MQDPDMSGKRYHHAIFVETSSNNGDIHHVTGDITSKGGMVYQCKPSTHPRTSKTFKSADLLGITSDEFYPDEWYRLLQSLETPPQQKAFNKKTMKTEPFKTLVPLTFYEKGEQRAPLKKCTEWTEETAIPALEKLGYIWTETSQEASSSKDEPKHKHTKSSRGKGKGKGKGKEKEVEWEYDEQQKGYRRLDEKSNTYVYWDDDKQCEKYWTGEKWKWIEE